MGRGRQHLPCRIQRNLKCERYIERKNLCILGLVRVIKGSFCFDFKDQCVYGLLSRIALGSVTAIVSVVIFNFPCVKFQMKRSQQAHAVLYNYVTLKYKFKPCSDALSGHIAQRTKDISKFCTWDYISMTIHHCSIVN